ncbi:MAG: hypothetical protein GXP42_05360 [Chloroflexi bacterium]|nr:hypothetical protein [Chloroflexota bacterium]
MHYFNNHSQWLPDLTRGSYLRGALVASMGFVVASALGLVLGVVLLKSPLVGWGLNLAGEDQALQRLLLAILFFVMGMGFSGMIIGAIGGWVLALIDFTASRRRYIWAGAMAFGVPQAILIPIVILLVALMSNYNNDVDVQPTHLPILFGLFGLFYGMMAGMIFGFVSVGFKYGWGVLLVSMISGLFGGASTGWLLRIAVGAVRASEVTSEQGAPLLLILVAFYGAIGLGLGLIYSWFHRARRAGGRLPYRIGRFWRFVGVLAMILVLLNLAGVFSQLYAFAAMRPASTSTVLALETIAAAWSEPERVVGVLDASDVSVDQNGVLGLAWSSETSEVMLSLAAISSAGDVSWSDPIQVSANGNKTGASQVVADGEGYWRVVWAEASDHADAFSRIMYARCEEGSCSDPLDLAAQLPACAGEIKTQAAPAIAVDDASTTMVVWEGGNGVLLFASWSENNAPSPTPDCSPYSGARPRLVAVGGGDLILAYETDQGVAFARRRDGAWQAPFLAEPGANPALFRDMDGRIHAAWCGADARLRYRLLDEDFTEIVEFPRCAGDIALGQDANGRMHLVWAADEIVNNFGVVKPGLFLYDSVRLETGWSPAYVIARLRQKATPHMVGGTESALFLFWSDPSGATLQSVQPHYVCPDSAGSIYGDAILDVLENGPFRPANATIPFCRNEFLGLLYLPDPAPASMAEPSPYGAFDSVADQIVNARFEVLFTTMEWMKDENQDSPGFVFAQAVSALYEKVRANPEDYPRGMTVRILLGNYPELATFTFGGQVWNVMDVLQKAGLPEMENAELGWKVELANFDGQNPHSHAKFLVIDGREVMAAGFNYSYLHLNEDHPSGLGVSLVDFGMLMRGPVAQDAVAAYDDLWSGSTKILCPDLNPPEGDWQNYCTQGEAVADHVPEALLYYPAATDDVAFSLLRANNRPESDRALDALIRSAQKTIDVFEVNFSLKAYCALGILMDDFCSMEDSLAYMQALVDVIEQNRVRIRVLVTDVNMNGIENSVAIQALRAELARRGLSEQAEFRYYVGRMHPKAFLVDDAFLVVGSQNFHYSAWGDGRGLVEYNLATNNQDAIAEFQRTFEYFWENGVPVEEAEQPRVGE